MTISRHDVLRRDAWRALRADAGHNSTNVKNCERQAWQDVEKILHSHCGAKQSLSLKTKGLLRCPTSRNAEKSHFAALR